MTTQEQTFIEEVITSENYHEFANRVALSQLKKFLSNLKQQTESMNADEVQKATNMASYERIRTMLNDAIALLKRDTAYMELCKRLDNYNAFDYDMKKRIVRTLKARKERCKKPSIRPRRKPYTAEDEQTLQLFEKYIREYDRLQRAIDYNRLNRDDNNGHSNTASDILQTAYAIAYEMLGYAPSDIAKVTTLKNGKIKEQTALQLVRNEVQNNVRSEERYKTRKQSFDELTRYRPIMDSDSGEVVGYEEIEPLYVPSEYDIPDNDTYVYILSNINKICLSQQQERILKLRMKRYSLAQIADIETERKIKDECINALVFHGNIDRDTAKKRYATLSVTMTVYEIQNLMIDHGYIQESKKANPIKKNDIAKQLARIQEKYINVCGMPSAVQLEKAKK